MTVSNVIDRDVAVRIALDTTVQSVRYGFCVWTPHGPQRHVARITEPVRYRLAWLLRDGVMVADSLLATQRTESVEIKRLLALGLEHQWLERVPRSDVATFVLGRRRGALGLGCSVDPVGDLLPTTSTSQQPVMLDQETLSRYVAEHPSGFLLCYANATALRGLSALQVSAVGRWPIVVAFHLNHGAGLVSLPRRSSCCLECAARWFVGSHPYPMEMAAQLLSTGIPGVGWHLDRSGSPESAAQLQQRWLTDRIRAMDAHLTSGRPFAEANDMPQLAWIGTDAPDGWTQVIGRHPSCVSCESPDVATSPPISRLSRVQPTVDILKAHIVGPAQVAHSFELSQFKTGSGRYFLARAGVNTAVRDALGQVLYCFGDAADADEASFRCLAECLERYCVLHYDPANIIRGSYDKLAPSAIHPEILPLYSREQYEQPGFPYAPFDESATYGWISSTMVGSNGDDCDTLVPAAAVFLSFQDTLPLTAADSGGTAVNVSLEAAALGALLEVIERDALAHTFLGRRPGESIDGRGQIDDVNVDELRKQGFVVRILNVAVRSIVPVILIVATRSTRPPYLLKGAAAAMNEADAVRHAFREVWRSFLYYQQAPANLPTSTSSTSRSSIAYNIAYYQRADIDKVLGYLVADDNARHPRLLDNQPIGSVGTELDQLIAYVRREGHDPRFVDCTRDELRLYGLHCIRAVVPGYLPLSLGAQPWRLGRVDNAPVRLVRDDKELLSIPHFFS